MFYTSHATLECMQTDLFLRALQEELYSNYYETRTTISKFDIPINSGVQRLCFGNESHGSVLRSG